MRDANRQLHDMASHDMLTGVMNARAYYARCEELIQLAQRSGQPYAVLFVDLDHFKRNLVCYPGPVQPPIYHRTICGE